MSIRAAMKPVVGRVLCFAFVATVAVTGLRALAQQVPVPSESAKAAEANSNRRPSLFFRAEWKKRTPNPGEHPISQDDLVGPNLELLLYGAKNGIYDEQQEQPENISFAWTGLCESNCALMLRDEDNYVDLTGLAKIRWLTKQNGFHLLRPVIELADGTWLVGDHTDGYSADWRESEIDITDVHWRQLDPAKVVEAAAKSAGKNNFRGLDFTGWFQNPDLSKVDAVGFTDLMPGSGHGGGGSSRVQWIEVYGKPVPRAAPQSKLDAGGQLK